MVCVSEAFPDVTLPGFRLRDIPGVYLPRLFQVSHVRWGDLAIRGVLSGHEVAVESRPGSAAACRRQTRPLRCTARCPERPERPEHQGQPFTFHLNRILLQAPRDTVRVSGRKGLLYSYLPAIAEWTQ